MDTYQAILQDVGWKRENYLSLSFFPIPIRSVRSFTVHIVSSFLTKTCFKGNSAIVIDNDYVESMLPPYFQVSYMHIVHAMCWRCIKWYALEWMMLNIFVGHTVEFLREERVIQLLFHLSLASYVTIASFCFKICTINFFGIKTSHCLFLSWTAEIENTESGFEDSPLKMSPLDFRITIHTKFLFICLHRPLSYKKFSLTLH